ncbi:FecCD family ABC transporter permease [Embleya sp. NPDC127516]|uniref:FecCD family ABC transporter permease n=2 Tax=unclassified Embleya TaxID=2699296 RepID=UPI00382A14E3
MTPGLVLRDRRGRFSIRVRPRPVVVGLVSFATLVALMAVTLTTGEFTLSLSEVVRALIGRGSPSADFVVNTLRLPRLLTAVSVGAALAVSGAILQTVSGNPLGSPDVIGFTNGSATGALVVITVLHGGMTEIALGALVGGLATAVAVYLLAFGGGAGGFRLIVMGIGVGAILLALNSYLVTRADWQDALEAQHWLVGSLNNRGWDQANAMLIACLVLLPVAFGYTRRLSLLAMGDDSAQALGVDARRTRLVMLLVGVALAAVATAATGPVWFVALAAPQLSRRLVRSPGPGLVNAALMGAVLLTASDLAVQRLFTAGVLPVGVATGSLGGLYLLGLLLAESRRTRS